MPELNSITIKGFKSISSVESLKLEAINVVIGPNGSGKSNFIGVFSFLNAMQEGKLSEYVIKAGGADRILYLGARMTPELFIRLSFQADNNEYELRLLPTENDELVSTRTVPDYSSNWRLYHFHDTSANSPMKKTADLNDNRFFRIDGSNLAAFLYFLKNKHETSYSLILRTIQRVAPFIDDFVLEPQLLNPDKIRLEWKHKNSDAYFDASSLSDGTLRFIALTTLFLQPKEFRPSIILVDEPELGLHPFAITMLASLVKQVSIETQVILATQSPLLVDHFKPEDILVTETGPDGTQFKRLESEPLKEWLEDYSLGQLWKKNEIGGRPGGSW